MVVYRISHATANNKKKIKSDIQDKSLVLLKDNIVHTVIVIYVYYVYSERDNIVCISSVMLYNCNVKTAVTKVL